MDFELPEELAEVQKLAHDFAEKDIAPSAAQDDREHRFRKDLVGKMGELGFYGCLIPEEFGGNGLRFLAHTLISEEIARVHSAIRVYLNMQAGPAVTLFEFGNEEQKKRYLRDLLSGESIGLFAITEPDAGSDVAAMKTTASATVNIICSTAPRSGSPMPQWRMPESSLRIPIGPKNIAAYRPSTPT